VFQISSTNCNRSGTGSSKASAAVNFFMSPSIAESASSFKLGVSLTHRESPLGGDQRSLRSTCGALRPLALALLHSRSSRRKGPQPRAFPSGARLWRCATSFVLPASETLRFRRPHPNRSEGINCQYSHCASHFSPAHSNFVETPTKVFQVTQ
jgi:hypothetical protein